MNNTERDLLVSVAQLVIILAHQELLNTDQLMKLDIMGKDALGMVVFRREELKNRMADIIAYIAKLACNDIGENVNLGDVRKEIDKVISACTDVARVHVETRRD